MTHPPNKNSGSLRVVLEYGGRFALVAWARVERGEIYTGHMALSSLGIEWKVSQHVSGQKHLQLRGRIIPGSLSHVTPPQQLQGVVVLAAGRRNDLGPDAWDYKPKRDTPTRKTLIVNGDPLINRTWNVRALTVEANRPELAQDEIHDRPGIETIAHVVMDWTSPIIALEMFALTPDAEASLQRAIAPGT